MTRALYKRHARMGPGGMNCSCCGPAPGDARKRAKRTWRRSEHQQAMREAMREILDEPQHVSSLRRAYEND